MQFARLRQEQWLIVISIVLTLAIISIGVTFYKSAEDLTKIILIGLCLPAIALLIAKFNHAKKIKAMELELPQFLRDIARLKKQGLTLNKAVVETKKEFYGLFTSEARLIANKISFGKSIDEALSESIGKTKSKILNRAIKLLQDLEKIFPVEDCLERIARDIEESYYLETKKDYEKSFPVFLYLLFFIFLSIIILLEKLFETQLPNFAIDNSISFLRNDFRLMMLYLSLIISLFIGIIVGIIAKQGIVDRIKKVFVLLVIGFFIFQVFVPIPNSGTQLSEAIDLIDSGKANKISFNELLLENKLQASELTLESKLHSKIEFKINCTTCLKSIKASIDEITPNSTVKVKASLTKKENKIIIELND